MIRTQGGNDSGGVRVTIAFRPATEADSGRIAEVYLGSRKMFLWYARSPHSDDAARAWVRDILLAQEDVSIATVADLLVGFISVHRADGITWITQFYLDPSWVCHGIGSSLLTRTLATAPRPIRLYTFQENAGARRFYERNGFSPVRFSDGHENEERCPDVLYELAG